MKLWHHVLNVLLLRASFLIGLCVDLLTYIAIFRQQLYNRVTHDWDSSDIACTTDTTVAFDTSQMLTSAVLSVFIWLIGVQSVVFNDWFAV